MSVSKAPDRSAERFAATAPPSHWFFLRGLARESGHWGDFLSRFQERFPNARATALDLPGYGRRAAERSPNSVDEIMRAVREEFLKARAREPEREPFLFAVSLGGMTAASWLAAAPEDFRGAVLANSSFRGWSPTFRRLTPEACGRFVGILSAGSALARERAVLQMVSNRPEIRERVAAEWAALEAQTPIRAENFMRQLWAAARFQAPAQAPARPVLVLASDRDRMVHPSCSQEIAYRWGADLRRHPSAGHDLPLDAPDWTIEQTLEWTHTRVFNSAP